MAGLPKRQLNPNTSETTIESFSRLHSPIRAHYEFFRLFLCGRSRKEAKNLWKKSAKELPPICPTRQRPLNFS